MKLIVDIGNTLIKAAVFNGDKLERSFEFEAEEQFISKNLTSIYNIEYCLISSVKTDTDRLICYLKKQCIVHLFTAQTPLPIKNSYTTPETLGSDRLAAVAGASALYPYKNVLVIDTGTCIKYNFISDKNEFVGGGISLGLQMRFKALNTFTARLPLLNTDESFLILIGATTNDNILSGVQTGIIAEVDGIIDQYKSLYNNLTVVITGGDFNFFVKRLKNSIFADQFLILKGLNKILDNLIDAK
jgi:type III pantothenate kinase